MWIDGQVPDIVESDQAFPTEENSRGDNWVAVVINETKLSNAVSVLSSPSASISFFLFFLHITEMNRQCETTTSPPPSLRHHTVFEQYYFVGSSLASVNKFHYCLFL